MLQKWNQMSSALFLSVIGIWIRNMGHSALGAAVLDLPEYALLLKGICFFPL